MTLRVFSYGGGVQSTAALVLATQGQIDFKTFLFCNVGDDSENPATIEYVEQIARPYALNHGIEIIELQATRFGEPDTIFQRLTRPGSRSIGIPVRMNGSGAPGRRSCTVDFKILVVDKWLKAHDAKTSGAQVGLGISLDEIERVKSNTDPDTVAWKENVFPLLDEVERPLSRQDCMNSITRAGLPVPPKSSCWFCPYHKLSVWQEMRQDQPERFWKAVELEKFLNQRRADLGMDPVWFTRLLKPLDEATHEYGQHGLFDEVVDACAEPGYCMI
jgi:hypothetical protein